MKFLWFILVLVFCGHTAAFLGVNSITKEVVFQLYTRDNPEEPITLTVDSVLKDSIKRDIPWKFLIHGWTTSPSSSPWFNIHRTNYLKKGEYNILFVDWSKPANQSYVESTVNARGTGKYLAEFIVNLKKNGVPLNQIHLLGHSLGSHMSGFAGKYVYEMTKEKVDRITGTDPARPIFEMPWLLPANSRLSNGDAVFVDVIHTDAGNYGFSSPIGHIDFYPNGGKRFQPGCENDDDINCSHARSVGYFGESILTDQFIARQCSSYKDYQDKKCSTNTKAIFGENVDRNLRGLFYFTTNSQPPYALGE